MVYQGAFWIYKRANFNPLLNPVPLSVAVLVLILTVTSTPYQTYFDGAQFVHFLLGPATVALAVPLYPQLGKLRRAVIPVIGALFAGGVVAAGSAVGIAWLLGASDTTLLSIAPKSVTAPIAMGISEKIGGLQSLTAVLVMVTGVIGVISAKYILNFLKIGDHAVRGFSIGVAAHGMGIARAFQVSEEAGGLCRGGDGDDGAGFVDSVSAAALGIYTLTSAGLNSRQHTACLRRLPKSLAET